MKQTFATIGCRIAITVALLAILMVNVNIAGAEDVLRVNCNIPGGYCPAGTKIQVSDGIGGGVLIPNGKDHSENSVILSICPTNDGVTADSGCAAYFVNRRIDRINHGSPWSTYTSFFTGTFTMPYLDSSRKWCLTGYIQTSTPRDNVYYFYSYGSTYQDTYKSLCAVTVLPPPPDFCYVNSGNPITVDFGSVERTSINTTPGSSSDVQKTLTVNCMGSGTHGINVRLAMTPTGWSNGQVVTSNPALGVSISANGKQLNNRDSFAMNVNGSSTANLTFSLLRDPKKQPTDVSTGTFNASATLIVTEP